MDKFDNLFILGNPRSGTSLIRIMLNCHSKVVIPPESGFLVWWYKKYKDIDISNVDDFINDILSSKKIETWSLEIEKIKNQIKLNQPRSYAEFANIIYLSYALQHNKIPKILGDKNNYYTNHTKEILTIYPNAKFIHIIRDPRDVARSYKNIKNLSTNSEYKPILPENANDIAIDWNKNNNNIIDLFKQINNSNHISIRYEDLLTNTHYTIDKICEFLNIEIEKQIFDFHSINKDNNIEPHKTLDWKKKTREPIDSNNIGRFREILTTQEIHIIEEETRYLRHQFNYV